MFDIYTILNIAPVTVRNVGRKHTLNELYVSHKMLKEFYRFNEEMRI